MSPVSAIAVIGISVIPATLMQDGQQQGSFSAMRPFMAGMYAIPLAIGVWWLVYFNRRDIKSAFAAPYEPGGPPLRPLSISIIGWMSVVGGAFSIPLALTQVPAFVAGFVVTGWAAALIYVGFGAVSLYLGWAVLKLRELGRRLMIAWYGLAIAHAVYMSLVPSVRVRLADMQRAMPFLAPATAPDFQSSMMIAMMLFGVAVGAVIIWFLVKERSRFSSSPS